MGRFDRFADRFPWKSVLLIAGMLPMGIAMENTGTAQLMADWIVVLIGDRGALAVLAGIYLMTGLLTEVMSNWPSFC